MVDNRKMIFSMIKQQNAKKQSKTLRKNNQGQIQNDQPDIIPKQIQLIIFKNEMTKKIKDIIFINPSHNFNTVADIILNDYIDYEYEKQQIQPQPPYLVARLQPRYDYLFKQLMLNLMRRELSSIIFFLNIFEYLTHQCKLIINNNAYQSLNALVIILNCIQIASQDPTDDYQSKSEQYIEYGFIFFYTIDVVLNLQAYGIIFSKKSFFRSFWCIIDFIVVFFSWLNYFDVFRYKLNFLRSLRILKLLNTLQKVKSLQIIIQSYIQALPQLQSALILLGFYYFTFSMIGLLFFAGKLKNRCINEQTGIQTTNFKYLNGYSYAFCASKEDCPINYICSKLNSNPQFELTNFDSLGYAFLFVFQSTTLEGWFSKMIMLQKTYSFWSWTFSLFLILAGPFFLVNLLIAIIKINYFNKAGMKEKKIKSFNVKQLRQLQLFKSKQDRIQEKIIEQKDIKQYFSKKLPFKFQRVHNFDKKQNNWSRLVSNVKFSLKQNDYNNLNSDQSLDQQNNELLPNQIIDHEKSIHKIHETKGMKLLQAKSSQIARNLLNNLLNEKTIDSNQVDVKDELKQAYQQIITFQNNQWQSVGCSDNNFGNEFDYQEILELEQEKKSITFNIIEEQKLNAMLQKIDIKLQEKQMVYDQNVQELLTNKNELLFMHCDLKKQFIDHSSCDVFVKEESKEVNLQINSLVEYASLDELNFEYCLKNHQQNTDIPYTKKFKQSKQSKFQKFKLPIFKSKYQKLIKDFDLDSKDLVNRSQHVHRTNIDEENLSEKNYQSNVFSDFLTAQKIFQNSYKKQKQPNEFQLSVESKKQQNVLIEEEVDVQLTLSKIQPNYYHYDELHKQMNRNENIKLMVNFQAFDIFKFHDKEYDYIKKRFNKIINSLQDNKFLYNIWSQDIFLGQIQKIKLYFYKITISNTFNYIITLIILLNTLTISSEGLFDNQNILKSIEIIEVIFVFIYTIELLFKVIGLGPLEYLSNGANIFDGIITVVSVVEVYFFYMIQASRLNVSAFRVLRLTKILRIFRFTRLMRNLRFMIVIIRVLTITIKQLLASFLLAFVFIIIFILFGMQIFGGQFTPELSQEIGGFNFDTFSGAYQLVWQTMTLENWNTIFYVCLRTEVSKFMTCLYFITWIFIGNYTLLNIFLSTLIDSFESDQQMILEEIMLHQGQDDITLQTDIKSKIIDYEDEELNDLELELKLEEQIDQLGNNSQDLIHKHLQKIHCMRSFYIFNKYGFFRKSIVKIVHSKSFDYLVTIIILAQNLKIFYDSYENNDEPPSQISNNIEKIFIIFFGVEILLKTICFGVYQDKNSYFKKTMNIIDFLVVLFYIIQMEIGNSNFKEVAYLRVLRPIRILTRNPNLTQLISALSLSLTKILNVLIALISIWQTNKSYYNQKRNLFKFIQLFVKFLQRMMFAIIGMNLMAKKLCVCQQGQSYLYMNESNCISNKGTWKTYDVNFDNIFASFLSIFILTTLEGWPNILQIMMDANDCDIGPQKNQSEYMQVYMNIFIVIGSQFCISLLVSVISIEFLKQQEIQQFKELSRNQKDWIKIQNLILIEKDDFKKLSIKYKSQFIQNLGKLLSSKEYELVSFFITLLNIIFLAMNHENPSQFYRQIDDTGTIIFCYIFIIETIVKITVFGTYGFFYDSMNWIDFIVSLSSIVELLYLQKIIVAKVTGLQTLKMFRMIRLTKMFSIVKTQKGVVQLIQVAQNTLPHFMYVFILVLLSYVIFSMYAGYVFKTAQKGDLIGIEVSFSNIGDSFFTLFRCSTGEDWYIIMYDLMNYNCDSQICKITTGIFFVVFIVIQQYVLLNLFILVLIQQFEENVLNPNDILLIYQRQVRKFKLLWIQHTQQTNGDKILYDSLQQVYCQLDRPIGFKSNFEMQIDDKMNQQAKQILMKQIYQQKCQVGKLMMKMDLQSDQFIIFFMIRKGYFYFHQVLYNTFKYLYHERLQQEPNQKMKLYLERYQRNIETLIQNKTQQKIKEQDYYNEDGFLKNPINILKIPKVQQQVNITSLQQRNNPLKQLLFNKMFFLSWKVYTRNNKYHLKDLSNQSMTTSENF